MAQQSLADALRARGMASRTVRVAAEMDVVVAPPESVEQALHALESEAGVIFVGQVTTVLDRGGYHEITFYVEQGVRGVASGASYVMREWAGLSPAGKTRYREGQRLLALLHEPSVAGYSSPVGGADGLIPLYGGGMTDEADLRWVATRVRRAQQSGNGQGVASVRMLPLKNLPKAEVGVQAAPADLLTQLEQPRVERTLVVSLLQVWERERAGAQQQ